MRLLVVARIQRERDPIPDSGGESLGRAEHLPLLVRVELPHTSPRLQFDARIDPHRLLATVVLLTRVGSRADVDKQRIASDDHIARDVSLARGESRHNRVDGARQIGT